MSTCPEGHAVNEIAAIQVFSMWIYPFYRIPPPVPGFYIFSQVLQLYEDNIAWMHHLPIPDPDLEYDTNPLESEVPTNVVAEDVDSKDSSKEDEDPEEYPLDVENPEYAEEDSSKEGEDPEEDSYYDPRQN